MVAVAMMDKDEQYTGGQGIDNRDEAKANAALIVKAVNSHDKLVEALEAAADAIYRAGDYMPTSEADIENGEAYRAARAALEEAKG